jgi:methyl-accepting chemotaxis protein
MADENEKSEPTAEGFEPAPEPRALSEDEIREAAEQAADGIAQLGGADASSSEVSRQLEELTNVVLSSAEVSTRSASVAADVSGDMKQVTERIADDHKRTVFHSRTLMIAMLLFVVLAVGSLFAVSVRLL